MLSFYLSLLETAEDQQKFTRLYETYEKKLYAIALQLLHEPARAEDALQQCWLKLIQHRDAVSALSWTRAGAYAVTTVKNTALDILRRERHTVPFPETNTSFRIQGVLPRGAVVKEKIFSVGRPEETDTLEQL